MRLAYSPLATRRKQRVLSFFEFQSITIQESAETPFMRTMMREVWLKSLLAKMFPSSVVVSSIIHSTHREPVCSWIKFRADIIVKRSSEQWALWVDTPIIKQSWPESGSKLIWKGTRCSNTANELNELLFYLLAVAKMDIVFFGSRSQAAGHRENVQSQNKWVSLSAETK